MSPPRSRLVPAHASAIPLAHRHGPIRQSRRAPLVAALSTTEREISRHRSRPWTPSGNRRMHRADRSLRTSRKLWTRRRVVGEVRRMRECVLMRDERARTGGWIPLAGVALTCIMCAGSDASGQPQQAPSRPNIVVFLTDPGLRRSVVVRPPHDQDAEHRSDGARGHSAHVVLRGAIVYYSGGPALRRHGFGTRSVSDARARGRRTDP
jgi:hypothetical protein